MYGNFSAEECLFNMYTLPNALSFDNNEKAI